MATETENGTAGGTIRELLIDRQLPRFEARALSTVPVDAGTEQTYRAVRALDPELVGQSVRFMRLMGQLRQLPVRIAAIPRMAAPPAPEALAREQYRDAFLLIDEEPGVEFVIGMIGKFMSPTQMEFRRFDPPDFAAPNPATGRRPSISSSCPTGPAGPCCAPRPAQPPPIRFPPAASAATGRSSARSLATSCGTG